MDVDEKYFSNITKRERAIFEGAISMGALFHQFVGTPVNKNTKKLIPKSTNNNLIFLELFIFFILTPKTKHTYLLSNIIISYH